jgi:hypothetical protein
LRKFISGVWLRAKTLRILKEEYGYDPAVPGFQGGVFGGCVRHVTRVGGTERDAAALFMLSQIGMMSDPRTLDEKGKNFVRDVRDKI